jgi:hypothetical protein
VEAPGTAAGATEEFVGFRAWPWATALFAGAGAGADVPGRSAATEPTTPIAIETSHVFRYMGLSGG